MLCWYRHTRVSIRSCIKNVCSLSPGMKVQLKDYLDMAQEFMDELEQSESKPQA
jgi:hypothetical protein